MTCGGGGLGLGFNGSLSESDLPLHDCDDRLEHQLQALVHSIGEGRAEAPLPQEAADGARQRVLAHAHRLRVRELASTEERGELVEPRQEEGQISTACGGGGEGRRGGGAIDSTESDEEGVGNARERERESERERERARARERQSERARERQSERELCAEGARVRSARMVGGVCCGAESAAVSQTSSTQRRRASRARRRARALRASGSGAKGGRWRAPRLTPNWIWWRRAESDSSATPASPPTAPRPAPPPAPGRAIAWSLDGLSLPKDGR